MHWRNMYISYNNLHDSLVGNSVFGGDEWHHYIINVQSIAGVLMAELDIDGIEYSFFAVCLHCDWITFLKFHW